MILFNEKFNNTKYLKSLFNSLNFMYFDNSLPEIPVIIVNNENLNGCFKFDFDFEHKLLKNPRIELSIIHNFSYTALEKTLIHEMAHYKVYLGLTPEKIKEAFAAYDNNDSDTVEKLLEIGKYGHINGWKSIISEINHKYNIKIDIGKY